MIEFTWVDLTIALVFAISTIIGIYRGLIREMLTVVVWTIAFILAIIHGKSAGELFTFIDSASVKKTCGMVLIFVSVIILGFVIKFFLFRSKGMSKASGLDRFLGAVFGVARAVLVVVLALTFLKPMHMEDQVAFEKSILAPQFDSMVALMSVKMPPKWQRKKTANIETAPSDATLSPVADITPTSEEPIMPPVTQPVADEDPTVY